MGLNIEWSAGTPKYRDFNLTPRDWTGVAEDVGKIGKGVRKRNADNEFASIVDEFSSSSKERQQRIAQIKAEIGRLNEENVMLKSRLKSLEKVPEIQYRQAPTNSGFYLDNALEVI